LGLGILAPSCTETREQFFCAFQRNTRLSVRPGLDEDLKSDVTAIAPTRVTRAETFRIDARCRDHRLTQNAAAHVRRARVALGKLLARKIASRASEIVVTKLFKVSSEQRGLLEFFGRRRDSFGSTSEIFKRVCR